MSAVPLLQHVDCQSVALPADATQPSPGMLPRHMQALRSNCRVSEKTIQKIMVQVDLNQDGKVRWT